MQIVGYFRNRLRHTALRQIAVLWRHVGVTPDDVFLASYPKSGTTWLRFMVIHVLSGKDPERVNQHPQFPSVGWHRSALSSFESGGRLITTHEPYRSSYHKAVLLLRDGRDVLVSYYHHLVRFGMCDLPFEEFVIASLKGKMGGYGSWHQHTRSWLQSPLAAEGRLLVVRYEDMVQDCAAQLRRVCDFLGIGASQELIEAAVASNSLQAMKNKESRGGLRAGRVADMKFVRRGRPGGWKEMFTDELHDVFMQRAADVMQELNYV